MPGRQEPCPLPAGTMASDRARVSCARLPPPTAVKPRMALTPQGLGFPDKKPVVRGNKRLDAKSQCGLGQLRASMEQTCLEPGPSGTPAAPI